MTEIRALPTSARRWHLPLLIVTSLIVALDRYTKSLVVRHIGLGDTIPVFPRHFRISNVRNTGAAFSLFADGNPQRVRYLLIAFTFFAVLAVLAAFWRAGRTLSFTSIALALILGGAVGNLYDRLAYGYVVDFLEVTLRLGSWSYHWPDFNLADSAIVTGACLLLFEIFRGSSAGPDS